MKMAMSEKRLRDIDVKEVSLVDKAANKRRYTLLKATDENPEEGNVPKNKMIQFQDLGVESEEEAKEVEAAFDLLEGLIGDDVEKQGVLAKALGIEIEKESEEVDDEPGDEADDAVAEVGDQLEKIEKRIQALEKSEDSDPDMIEMLKGVRDTHKETLERLEKAESRTSELVEKAKEKEYLEKAEGLSGLPIEKETLSKSLREIDDNLSEENAEAVHTMLKSLHEAFLQSDLLETFGNRGGDAIGGDALQKLEKAAEEIQEKDSDLTEKQAFTKAAKANPELYQEYLDSRGQA